MKRIARDKYLNELIARKDVPLIKIITGLRRCGKSFLLNPIFVDYLIKSGVPEENIIYLNLELDENEVFRDRKKLRAYVEGIAKDDQAEYYVLLDEIQLVEKFEGVLSSFLARGNMKVYVTGSNSKFLSSDIITEFRGRSEEIHMYPLSFKEFMSAYDGDKYAGWQEYLRFGGLPLVTTYADGKQKMGYLDSQKEKTYLRDMIQRHNIRNDAALRSLIEVIASSVGSLTNPYKLENTFRSMARVELSRNTIDDYLKKLEEAYLIESAKRYDVKGKKYIETPLKYYFTDLGIRNSFVGFRQNEENHLMENVIYNELRMRGYSVDVGVVEVQERNKKNGKVERKQLEIDFVASDGDKRYYVQSALTVGEADKRKQELRPLEKVGDFFKKVIVTSDLMLPSREENGVVVMNILDFLLNEESLEREMG